MDLRKLLSVPGYSPFADIALLLLRLVAGLAFVFHGWPKIQNPFGWMGPDGFAPGLFQALAALSEFTGGLAWIVGLLIPLSSLGIACTMVVAVCMHAFMRGDPFVSAGGSSYELAAIYFCISILLLAAGPGRFSADRKIFGSRLP
jgi:putative oxidoreductase